MKVFGDISISVLDGITALIDKSMLQQTAYGKEEPRLYFLEILREYGLERLGSYGELEKTRDAHAAYYMALAEAAVFHTNQAARQALVECEVGNLRSAIEWLLERSQSKKALRIVAALEQTSKVSREDNVFISAQVKARIPKVARYQVFNQFDLDLTDVHFEENERLNRQHHDQQEVVINSNYMDNITPRRRNRVSGSTELFSSSAYGELTTREIEVLRLLAMGLSNKQIAERLVLSPHTVSGHIQSIFGKLALNSRSAATRYALEHHLT